MIHLYTLVAKDLKGLLSSKAQPVLIGSKTFEIVSSCETFTKEHDQQKEVIPYINMIRMAAIRMNRASSGTGGLGNSGKFNYEMALRDEQAMEKDLKIAAELLGIELKELNS